MPVAELALRFDPAVVVLSYLTAAFASYVALDLAQRVRTPDALVARIWWIAGSLSMGTGIWAMHFVGMLALKLPFLVGYDTAVTLLSWLAAVGVSAIALRVAAQETLTPPRLALGAVSMGAGICAMHYTGMAALVLAPGIQWHWGLVAASAAVATGAAAAALCIFFGLRRLPHAWAKWGQVVAALVMGAAVAGMHYTGMAAAGIVEGAVCLSTQGLRGDNLGYLVAGATFALLLLTLITSALDARGERRTNRLQQSLQAATTELHALALRDALTGLANRQLLDDRLQHAAARGQREGARVALLVINLDGFKPINDSFGLSAGDHVLRETARRLQGLARNHDTLARLGADEFVLMIEGEVAEATLAQVAQRLLDALAEPMADVPGAGNQPLRLSASVGVALYDGQGPGEALIAQADSAAQAAKRAGGNGFAFFEAHMQAGVREQVELARDLRAALAGEPGSGVLALHYQPKIATVADEVTGVEALLRWQHPQRGAVSPGVLIPVAERFGLIVPLGDWVINESCRQLAAWRDIGLQMRVAINLSVQQLRQPDALVKRFEETLARHGIDAGQLTCEITESVAMDDAAATERALRRLAELGLALSIDDFGTGYSSLSYLRQLPVSQLKIDRSFIQDLETSADARAIVKAVIELAHALGLQVVAEGVETQGQAAVLRGKRCDKLQGFLFARPMPAEQLTRWARGHDAAGSTLRFSPSVYGALDTCL
ncbi:MULTISPECIES: bifunctional diguanylate cyclase/phosphodiesterase [unclassified Roseateles]|uniref:putative bifunctional diguanylate cyclase/phosphodiesterase n=1 Tax=unclassified Roseateles TaxID=2626991 RepID=UPI0006F31766|nr:MULTISPECIES: EAL domain-containing protein [unclassified Roseateles]KQW46540.1 diguanylate phosphodiesterase [Pelomonas sp. Root405]KRA73591.1 diguanylate phosphodiesterase [Pelomonas sp. Root662]